MLFIQKTDLLSAPTGDMLDLEKNKGLADTFWKRWRVDYLTTLQPRKKWNTEKDSLQIVDVVLLMTGQKNGLASGTYG